MTIIAVALIAATGSAAAQDTAPIETDRPDYTEASSLVPGGRQQLELGWTTTTARADAAPREHSWPEALLRVGLSGRLELRLGQSFTSVGASGGAPGFTARNDTYVGVKVALGEQEGARPQLAMLLQASIPTGDDRLTSDEVLPGGALLAGWGTQGPWSFAAGMQVNRSEVDGLELGPSFATGLALGATLKAYGEWFAALPVGADIDIPSQHYLNGGLALRLSNDAQLDGRIGFGLTDASSKMFLGLGLALRR